MKNVQKKFVSTVAAMMVVFGLMSSANAASWLGWGKIVKIYPDTTGFNVLMEKSSTYSTCDGGTRFKVLATHPNYSAMVSSITAAFLAQLNSNFAFSTSETTCAPAIDRFQAEQ